MTFTQNTANTGARWSVMWLGKKGIVQKKYDFDYGEALRVYTLLSKAGKKLVTLHCDNVGFDPPRRLTHHEVERIERVIRRRKGRRVLVRVRHVDVVNLIGTKYNPVGIWWCPYCIKLRPFKQRKDWTGRVHMVCPVCGINERNFHVRLHNPQAKVIEYTRSKRGRRRRR